MIEDVTLTLVAQPAQAKDISEEHFLRLYGEEVLGLVQTARACSSSLDASSIRGPLDEGGS